MPAARTPLRDVYLVADCVRGCNAPTPVETITDYIWSDATGAGDLLAAARKLEVTESSSVVPPSLRSVGVVPLADIHVAQQKTLVPTVVRELLVRWLGLPAQARRAAVPLADRLMRRAGISADTIIQQVSETLLTPAHRTSLEQAIADLSPEQQHDQVAVAAALQSVIESMLAQANFQTIPTDVINNVHRELTVCLIDRRADLTTVIECLKLIQEKIVSLKASCPADQQNVPNEHERPMPVERHGGPIDRFAVFRPTLRQLEFSATTARRVRDVACDRDCPIEQITSHRRESLGHAFQRQFDRNSTRSNSRCTKQPSIDTWYDHSATGGPTLTPTSWSAT